MATLDKNGETYIRQKLRNIETVNRDSQDGAQDDYSDEKNIKASQKDLLHLVKEFFNLKVITS